jgi:uncharacterized protein YceK
MTFAPLTRPKNLLMQLAGCLILFQGCSSYATREPLSISVGVVRAGARVVDFVDREGNVHTVDIELCERGLCVVLKTDDFEKILKRCVQR